MALLALAAGAPAATLTRGPYLQKVTTQSALVVWRTAEAVPCTLGYGPGFATTVVTPAATQHVAALAGLQPGTRTDYRIRAGGLLAGGSDHFVRTAPLPGAGTVRFLVWGDSGKGNAAQAAVAARLVLESADLALVVGDIVYPSGEAALYDAMYFQPYAPLLRRVPVYGSLGNHDAYNVGDYLDAWYLPTNPVNGSELFYSFDHGDVHFVCLDSNPAFGTALLDWLRLDLQGTSRRWKVVFFHHPLYSCGQHGSDDYLIDMLAPIFDATDVDLVLTGHDHDYQRSYPVRAGAVVDAVTDPNYVDPGGPIYVVSGGGADVRSTSSACWFTARAHSASHFTRVQVAGDSLVLEPIGTSGQVLDRLKILKAGSTPPSPGPAAVQVLAPLGGEVVEVDVGATVRWASANGVGPVRIELSRDGPAGPWQILFSSTPNDGAEFWSGTGPPSDNCWIRISEVIDGSPVDVSDTPFRLVHVHSGPGASIARLDFRPPTGAPATGWLADTGAPFDPGLGRGWNAPVSTKERSLLPGDPRDSFAEVVNNDPVGVWEMELPNGDWFVSLTCGDPLTSATHRVALEGQIVVADVYTSGGNFVERRNLPVTVADGRLTLTLGGIGTLTRTKLTSLEVWSSDITSDAAPAASGPSSLSARPNPFNPAVRLDWVLATRAHVRLTVHDAAGRRVATLLDGTHPAGPMAYVWLARDGAGRPLPSGLYLARLQVDGAVETRKLVLVR